MRSLTEEYNRRYKEGGLKLAWIEKAVNDTPGPWISVEERLPDTDEDGYSKYVLAAFHNYSGVDIAQYREDQEGGAWYPGDMEESYSSMRIFVRAWMPLPDAPEEA